MQKTLVSVHGYAGDAHQISNNLPLYEHHNCPVVIFSPEDSKIQKMGPHLCRFGGKRQYMGADSLERQKIHLRILLEYPFDFFLMNDSDSFCISPKIPAYLFEEKGILWSNEVSDAMHSRPPGYQFPQLAFQPPYFFSREVIERLLTADVSADPKTPFIDWVMMAWAIDTKCPHRNYRDGLSCPTNEPHCAGVMADHVLNRGRVMLHSIKTLGVMRHLVACYNRRFRPNSGGSKPGPRKVVDPRAGYPVFISK